MEQQILAYCKNKQEQAIKAHDWATAQDYQDMQAMWQNRFNDANSKQPLAA